jgi:3-ketosteroid 9alpha-monooxygenase subunit B
VAEVIEETHDARSVVFDVPSELQETFAYTPGQFLTVAVPSDRTGLVARSYSLSSMPADDGPITITVKRTEEGYASCWICDNLTAGDRLRVLPPAGIFTPKNLDADLLLFAGGSGITPIMSITRTALARGSGRIVLFYANRDERSVIFSGALAELSAQHPDRLQVVHWLESVQGLPTQEQMKAFATQYLEWDAFVCGPGPFMTMTVDALKELEFPRDRRHQEKFVSLGGNPFETDADREPGADDDEDASTATVVEPVETTFAHLQVELDGENLEYDDWPSGRTLLEHLESKGVKAPYSCRLGECSACAVRLLEGEVTMRNNDVLEDEDLDEGIRLACQSEAATEKVRVTYS